MNNGNWTEWSAILSEITRGISKSNEQATQVRFKITSMILEQNYTTRSSITTLLQPVWHHRIQSVPIHWSSSQFAEKGKHEKAFTTQKSSDVEKKWWDLKQEWCDLEPTNDTILEQMWFRAKRSISLINHTAETQSNCRDHQWFQDGYNKGNYYYLVLGSTAWWFRHTVKSICGNKNLVSRAYHQAPVVVKVDSTMPYPGQITFHQITQMVSLKFIQWIMIYPVDGPIQCLNNCTLGPFFF